jgi:hypothetical protein
MSSGFTQITGVRSMYYDTLGKQLYVSGQFKKADNKYVWGIARWKNNKWDSLSGGFTKFPNQAGSSNISPFCWQMIRFQNKLFCIGNLVWVNGKNQYNMGVWDILNEKWIYPLSQPLTSNSIINNMVVYNNELYVCGLFTKIGSVSCNYVAKFDGNTWQAVGNLVNYLKPNIEPGQINCLAWYKNELYVGGSFRDTNGTNAHIAKYDGTKWTTVGTGIKQGFAWINRMEVFNNELYLGGIFNKSTEIPKESLIKWDGQQFKACGNFDLQNGTSVLRLRNYKNKLYVLGNHFHFRNARDTISTYGFSFLDSSGMCNLNNFDYYFFDTPSGYLADIEFVNDSLIVGSGFDAYKGQVLNGIACFKNYQYSSNCIYNHYPPYSDFFQNLNLYPNPFTNQLIIKQDLSSPLTYALQLYNNLGQSLLVKEITEAKTQIDLSNFPQGMYFVKVYKNTEQKVFKVLKE